MSESQKDQLHLPAFLENNASTMLLMLTVFTIFVIPLMPAGAHGVLFNVSYSAIFFMSVITLQSRRRFVLAAALMAFFTAWLALIFEAPILLLISRIANVLFFNLVVVRLIIQIARYKVVNAIVITEAVSGYLLLGLMFSFFVLIIMKLQPAAFSFQSEQIVGMTDLIYFSFVTLTTLGYGDLLPVLPAARSLALLIAVTGQLYIAIIVATLVGKFLNQNNT